MRLLLKLMPVPVFVCASIIDYIANNRAVDVLLALILIGVFILWVQLTSYMAQEDREISRLIENNRQKD